MSDDGPSFGGSATNALGELARFLGAITLPISGGFPVGPPFMTRRSQ
jgi:hypothetical protein